MYEQVYYKRDILYNGHRKTSSYDEIWTHVDAVIQRWAQDDIMKIIEIDVHI